MYDNPHRQKYERFYDAGNTANETFTFKGPKGKAGRIYDYGIEGVTEAFTADASIAIGTAADPDAYGEELAIGVLAVDDVKTLRTLYDPIANKAAFDALLVDPVIPKDTEFVISVVDDAATGQGSFFVIVDWSW